MKYRETTHNMAIVTAAAIEYIEAQTDWEIAIQLIKDIHDEIDVSINATWLAENQERADEAFETWNRVRFSFAPYSAERARTEAMWKDMMGSHIAR